MATVKITLSKNSTYITLHETRDITKTQLTRYIKKFIPYSDVALTEKLGGEGLNVDLEALLLDSPESERKQLQKWHEDDQLVLYQDRDGYTPVKISSMPWTLQLGRPNIYSVSLALQEVKLETSQFTLYSNPHYQWSRLCIPADYANDKLLPWNQKNAKLSGSPWTCRDVSALKFGVIIGQVGQIIINSGSEAYLWDAGYYSKQTSHNPINSTAFNWTHDKTNKKFSYEFYLDSDLPPPSSAGWVEKWNDGQATFWTADGGGTGSISLPTLSDDTVQKQVGVDCLKIEVGAGTNDWWGIYHDYSPAEDWSGKEFLSFWWCGANSGKTFRVRCYSTDLNNAFDYNFTENFTGWKLFVIPLNIFTKSGSPNWNNIVRVRIYQLSSRGVQGTWYVDQGGICCGNWVKAEVWTPDVLKEGDQASIKLYSWNGSGYSYFTGWDAETASDAESMYNYVNLYFMDGTQASDIWDDSPFCITMYGKAERTQTPSWSRGNGGSITYSSRYGCKYRVGFAVKMPPDDGQDSSTHGISQCKLKMEVYYADDGKVTYQFENSLNQYYGLQNLNQPCLILFDTGDKITDFIILPNIYPAKELTGLEILADHDEKIHQIKLTYASPERLKFGRNHVTTSDLDGDGIPDNIQDATAEMQ